MNLGDGNCCYIYKENSDDQMNQLGSSLLVMQEITEMKQMNLKN